MEEENVIEKDMTPKLIGGDLFKEAYRDKPTKV